MDTIQRLSKANRTRENNEDEHQSNALAFLTMRHSLPPGSNDDLRHIGLYVIFVND